MVYTNLDLAIQETNDMVAREAQTAREQKIYYVIQANYTDNYHAEPNDRYITVPQQWFNENQIDPKAIKHTADTGTIG